MAMTLKDKAKHPSVWSSVIYFAEGLPYSIVHFLASLFFTYNNVKLEYLGLISLYHIPWNLKFLWSTLVDQFGTKRKWIYYLEFLLLITSIILAIAAPLTSGLTVAAVLFLVIAFFSATHDIAIDGYYLEKLNKEDQAKYVGMRVMAYRMAMLVVSSGLVYMAHISWPAAFWSCSAIMLLLFLYNYFLLPEAEKEQRKFSEMITLLYKRSTIKLYIIALVMIGLIALLSQTGLWSNIQIFFKDYSLTQIIGSVMLIVILSMLAIMPFAKKRIYKSESFFAQSFISLLDQPKIGLIIVFVLLFRLGESLLLSLKSPFFKGIGVTLEQLSLANGVFGMAATIVGSIFGGWLISRYSFKKMIWPCIISQNIFNLLYMFLAMYYSGIYFEGAIDARPEGMESANFYVVSAVIFIEAFGAGIGTAAFMVYIMRCVKASYKASHTAFWTAIMSIGVLLTGPISGALAKDYGFTIYFGLSFLITIPSMILILFVPYLGKKTAADYDQATT